MKRALTIGLASLLALAACGDEAGSPADSAAQTDAATDATAMDTATEDATTMDTATSEDATAMDTATSDDADAADVDPGPPPLEWAPYVRGTFNDWGTGAPMVYRGGGHYQVTLAIPVGSHMFKVANEAWRLDTIYSTDAHAHVEIPLATPMPLVIATGYDNDAVLNIPAEGQYSFDLAVTVDDAGPHLVLEVVQGELTPIEYPDDSAVETFPATAWTPVTPVGGSDRMPSPADLFAAVAIDVPAGERAQYLYGDNVDGYYEGWTHSYTTASRYRHHEGYLFTYAAALVGGHVLDATSEATGTALYPYGARTTYPDGRWEELVPHSGERALTLRVHSDTAAKLAIVPRLEIRRSSTDTWQRIGDAMVYALPPELRHAGSPTYVAIAGDRAHTVTGVDLAAHPELASVVGVAASNVKPIFETTGAETDFRLVLVFGDNAAALAAKARARIAEDSVATAQQAVYDWLIKGYLRTSDPTYDRALAWARLSARMMYVQELGAGLWAGLPWFKNNWGRDTFISLPGALLASGRFEEAEAVITNFASLQQTDEASSDYGRVPNVVNSPTDLNYNTTDGTPWLVREIAETVRATGDAAFADAMAPVVERYLDGAIAHHVDADGLLTHGDTATWMDAAFTGSSGALLPWSARGSRAVEIEALWITALRIGAALATARGDADHAKTWGDLADTAQASFVARFWDADAAVMADRLRADDSRDTKVRPNQLMLLSIPLDERLVSDEVEAHVLRNAVTALLYPYGIASLAETHPYFHPFHDHQTAYPKDAAYHNGTVWGWNAGFTVTALTRHGQVERAWELTRNLADQILSLGTRGAMSELLDAHPDAAGHLTPSGTFAQTWSVAEYARNALQDFVGFRPNLPLHTIELSPSIPAAWSSFECDAPFGAGSTLAVSFARDGAALRFTVSHDGPDPLTLVLRPLALGARYRMEVTLAPGGSHVLQVYPEAEGGPAGAIDRGPIKALPLDQPSQAAIIGPIPFVTPDVDASYPALEQSGYLQGIIERGAFQ